MSSTEKTPYKYRCRGCPIQESCIEESGLARGAKEMIRNAFAAKTDTLSTWGVLQKNCLLVKQDEEMERRAKEGSLLGRRLREARADQKDEEEEEENEEAPAEEELDPADEFQFSLMIGSSAPKSEEPSTAELGPASPRSADPSTDTASTSRRSKSIGVDEAAFSTRRLESAPPDRLAAPGPAEPRWLIIRDSRRRISLPISGELILGRFDPHLKDPLDVDLTFEDQNRLSVSRRHAKIVAIDGRHTIEDLGSSNGLSVNGVLVPPGRSHPLQPGDRLSIGSIVVEYEPVPPDLLGTLAVKAAQARHLLFLTPIGRKVDIAAPDNVTIGRADPAAGYAPSLDLSQDGDAAAYVSRRHALITWDNHTPYFKDLESTFGSRLNGQPLAANQAVPLKPGDHVSLGGYVLAYDVEW